MQFQSEIVITKKLTLARIVSHCIYGEKAIYFAILMQSLFFSNYIFREKANGKGKRPRGGVMRLGAAFSATF